MKSPHEWFYEIKQSEKEPIRLSDIDNLLEDSIFTSSNGAKLADYLRKKRGAAGRVRLQNIFEQVAANIPKPVFNFNMDSSDPNPLPESPQTPAEETNNVAESAPKAGTSAPTQNGTDVVEAVPTKPTESVLTPLVVLHDLKLASPKSNIKCSDPGVSNLGRQALLNQYHRTNMAKCELLRQITSSTPKPEAIPSLNRISAFTTSISPIMETGTPHIVEPDRSTPPPPVALQIPGPAAVLEVPVAPILAIDPVLPPQILAPCTQASTDITPRKVIVISTPALPVLPPDMIIPETPSPVKELAESPKVAHPILPRKLSVTFNNLEQQAADVSNSNITSDDSVSVEGEHIGLVEHIVGNDQPVEQETPMEQEQPIEHEQPVEQNQAMEPKRPVGQVEAEKEISEEDQESHELPAVLLPMQSAENSFITKSILKDSFSSSQKTRHKLRVSFSQQLVQQREISPAPSIPEAHYSSCSDDSSDLSDEDDFENCEYQVVDEVYSDDGDCDPNDIEENYNEFVRDDEELEQRLTEIHERIPSPLINVVDDAPVQWYETRTPRTQHQQMDKLLAPATCTKENKTDLQLVDIITDWDDEEDDEDIEKEDPEKSPIEESQPISIDIPETQQSTNVTVCNPMDISNMEDSAERLIDLPPPPPSINGTLEENHLSSPDKQITPPKQFTDSAKRRFLRDNEDALITRLQIELPPPSQPTPTSPDTPERVSEILIDVVQSYKDQCLPPSKTSEVSRKTIIPVKKTRRQPSHQRPVDKATSSYFEAVEKTFAKPTVPVPIEQLKHNLLTTAQKRRLYASSNGTAEPVSQNNNVESSAAMRNLKIIVQKLEMGNLSEKLTESDKAVLQQNNLNSKNVQPDSVDTNIPRNVTEVETKATTDRQQGGLLKQLNKNGPAPVSEISEQPFAGFDESTNLELPPDVLKNSTGKNTATNVHPNSCKDKVLDAEGSEEMEPMRNAPSRPAVGSKRVLRKKMTTKTKQSDKPAKEATLKTPVNVLSDEGLSRKEEGQDPLTKESGLRRLARKVKNRQAEKTTKPTSVEERTADSDERHTIDSQGALVGIPKGKKSAKAKKSAMTDDSGSAHEEVTLPEVMSTESMEERIIVRTPLDAVDVLPQQSQPTRRRGRPAAAAKVVHQSNLANSAATEETTPDTILSPASETSKDNGKEKETLPFKKRKGRMVCDDEPPNLEPFGEAAKIESNENMPPILVPTEPVPSTSKRREKQPTRDYHEKYTTEKPEKKLPKFYRDMDDADDTWLPNKKSLKNKFNRQLRKKADAVAGPSNVRRDVREEEPASTEGVRRSSRKRRLAEIVVKRNPNLTSIYEKPNYRQLTDEEFIALTREAKRRAEEDNPKKETKKTKTISSSNVDEQENHKQMQDVRQESTTSKRNRSDDVAMATPDEQPLTEPSSSTSDTDRNLSSKQMEAYNWMLKLMNTNGTHSISQEHTELIVGGQFMHYSQEHLSFRERNGIQYSFFLHSDTENYGFLRFAPSAVKKLTKTEKFFLKFLIIEGNLSFKLNGQKIEAKGGDFLMLPEYSTYAIENGENVSLIFMIKLCPSLCEP